jgi:leucyl-tRNA synthetase
MNAATNATRSLITETTDYEHGAIESRWQAAWAQADAFATPAATDEREPAYVLADVLSPGEDLQIGHIRGYTIADAYARFLRAHGRAVLFSVGFDASGPSVENRARQHAASAREWTMGRWAQMRAQLQALGCSMDWKRSFVSCESAQRRWVERPFSALVERGTIYQHAGRTGDWRLRVTAYVRDCERDLETLRGWDTTALAAQREALGRVDGVELDASTFDGTLLTVFTPYPNAIAQAAFIAVAPDHPDAGRWHAGAFATVPGVAGVLPIIVSEEVRNRSGAATAVLGIPTIDPADAAVARQLPEPAATAWKAPRTGATPRPTARWQVSDTAISSHSGMWSWLALCVPSKERGEELPEHPEFARWLPVTQLVCGADAAAETLHQRVIAKALQDAGQLPELPSREPFAKAVGYGSIRVEEATPDGRHHESRAAPLTPGGLRNDIRAGRGEAHEPLSDVGSFDSLIATVGADTLRLALLHAASPGTAFAWNDQPLRYCNDFLQSLHGYAAGRLREWSPRVGGAAGIDRSDRLRRRLALWCGVAHEKVTDSLARLAMQSAAHNAMRLLTRIEDFEQRALVLHGGELQAADREAIVAALLLLAQLLAPLTPHIAEELWSLAGNDSLMSSARWPVPGGRSGWGHPTAATHATPAGTARNRSTAASTASRAS